MVLFHSRYTLEPGQSHQLYAILLAVETTVPQPDVPCEVDVGRNCRHDMPIHGDKFIVSHDILLR